MIVNDFYLKADKYMAVAFCLKFDVLNNKIVLNLILKPTKASKRTIE